MEYTSFEINAINKFPELEPEEAIREFKKLVGQGGKKGKGKPKPWATFADKDRAREAQAKSIEARKNNK